MGYCYDMRGRLACDSCGQCGKVRKRTCPHKVIQAEGYSLPYCYPAALCPTCYAKHKPTLHATCKEAAAKRTAEEAARKAKIQGGDLEVRAAWGSWHESVPAGFVGVYFAGLGGASAYRLIPEDVYDVSARRWLSEYPDAIEWANPDARTTKEVTL